MQHQTQCSLTIFAFLGMSMLLGLVPGNNILLVNFASQRKVQGDGTCTALIAAGATILPPILMTSLAMVIGMIPVANCSDAGS